MKAPEHSSLGEEVRANANISDESEYILKMRASSDTLEVPFYLPTHRLAKRLWRTAVEHHTFFRLRETDSYRPVLPGRPPRARRSFVKRYASFTTGDQLNNYTGRTLSQLIDTQPPNERTQPTIKRPYSMRASGYFGDGPLSALCSQLL